jgi:hypothetical protein
MNITRRDVAILLTGVLAGLVLFGWYGSVRLAELQSVYAHERTQLGATFVTLAEQADRIEAIPASGDVVRDCSERARFEELLSSIPTLTARERTELDLLFASCGDYHARLKMFYAERLLSMSERYSTMATLHDAVFKISEDERRIREAMGTVASLERSRANDLFSLVAQQRVMNDVYAGRSSKTLTDVTTEAAAIEAQFAQSDTRIDTERAFLQTMFADAK